jgi:hypothetical protein
LLAIRHDMSYFHRGLSTDGPTKFRLIWPNEHSLKRTSHRCFLPSVGSFGQEVSDEKIF